jgi:DNA-directed RNA polymerase subunit L
MNYSSSTKNDTLFFTLSDVDKSFANAIRRTLIGNIPILVLKPVDCIIHTNTTRFTNEIIKCRIASIPIHHKKLASSFTIKLSKKNDTAETIYVTTEDFTPHELFLPTTLHGFYGKENSYIEFIRLRPGEEISFTCTTSIGTANESGMYNSLGTCSYGFTQDVKVSELAFKEKNGITKQDWDCLDAKRFTIPNSFDFTVSSIGVFENAELLLRAATILKLQFEHCKEHIIIETAATTIQGCFDVKITGDYLIGDIMIPMKGDYTIGKMLEYQLYQRFKKNEITYIAFFKSHPHDTLGTLRIAFKDATTESVRQKIVDACDECVVLCTTFYDVVDK